MNQNKIQINRNLDATNFKIDLAFKIVRKQPQRLLEILPSLLSCQKELLLENLRRRWPFSFKGQLEVSDVRSHFKMGIPFTIVVGIQLSVSRRALRRMKSLLAGYANILVFPNNKRYQLI